MSNKQLIILGTRGVPAQRGGFETFAEQLALYLSKQEWQVTVYCQSEKPQQSITVDEWQNIRRVHISPYFNGKIVKGALGTILFDLRSIWHALRFSRKSVWLVLGYNTAFANILPKLLKVRQIFNMDGIEWQRDKWSWPAKQYLCINYWIAGKTGNLLIADHPEIEFLLKRDFKDHSITMIPYGADAIENADLKLIEQYGLMPDNYLLLIARLEPENNILPVVKAWSQHSRKTKLVIVGNYLENNFYLKQLRKFASKDVMFLGSIYEKKTISALRFYCKAYLHGHSVGGTNPTLVESLGAKSAIIAHDNPFNRWVAGKAGIFFKNETELTFIFDCLEKNEIDLNRLKIEAFEQYQRRFKWLPILQAYERAIESRL